MKAWETIEIKVTIKSDENGQVWDINFSDGYRSISYDNYMPTIKEVLEDFDY